MAAHAVTGLIDCIRYVGGFRYTDDPERRQKAFAYVWPALNFSCWTEDIGGAWRDLWDACKEKDIEGLYRALILALPSAIKEWEECGFPDCREDWHKAKHKEDDNVS